MSILVALAILLVIFVPVARAETSGQNWSWSAEPIKVQYSRDVETFYNAGVCPSFYRYRDVSGEGEKNICITEGDKASFGIYYNSHAFPPVVSEGRSQKMYPLVGSICSYRYDSCLYEPHFDILVTKQYLINSLVRSLVIYKNFSERIEKRFNVTTGSFEYTFGSSSPDYVFESTSGYAWPIGGIGFSENGRWLGVEFRERGLGLLNLETMSMKRLTLSPSPRYGRGYDPSVEISVSDDGRYIAVAGMNAGLHLLENNFTCGDLPTDDRMQAKLPIGDPCDKIPLDTSLFMERFYVAYHPRFFNGGAELRFFAESYTGARKDVALRPYSVKASGINYIALGDSYSSGEGDMDDGHYLDGTNVGIDRCHVSDRSYPFNLAARFAINPASVKNVACSGAKIGDMLGDLSKYWGQSDRLRERTLGNEAQRDRDQAVARDTFQQGHTLQGMFVERYQPDLVTVGIGGNDLAMMAKLNSCAGPGTCEWAGDERARYQTGQEILSLSSELTDAYQRLRELSPNSTIAAVSYPQIIDGEKDCGGVSGSLFNRTERRFMFESIKLLNAVIRQSALRAGVLYIDVDNSLAGNKLCDSGARTINEVSLNLVESVFSKWVNLVGAESYHPNALGHALIAKTAFQGHPFLPYEMNGSPESSALLPALDEYWTAGAEEELPEQLYLGRLGGGSRLAITSGKGVLEIDPYVFEEDSAVRVEVHSEPQVVGIFSAGKGGGGVYEFDLPDNLAPGFHVLHAYGLSYKSGSPLDVYDIVKVASLDEPGEYSDSPRSDSNTTNRDLPSSARTEAMGRSMKNQKETLAQVLSASDEVDGLPSELAFSNDNAGIGESRYAAAGAYVVWAISIGVAIIGLAVYLKRRL